MKFHHKKQGLGRELDAFAQDSDALSESNFEMPADTQPYRYSCPVDHYGHMVNVRGLRPADSTFLPAILLIHDVGENVKMYRSSANYIASKGFACYGFDQRGHGESTDSMGKILSLSNLVKDLLQVVSWIKHLHGGKPPIIVGQGYGCLIVAKLASTFPDLNTAIVLSAPTVELARPLRPSRRLVMRIFAETLPSFRLPKFLRPRFSNPQHRPVAQTMATRIVKGILNEDDLKISGGFAWELITAMEQFPKLVESIQKPTLLVLPEADEVASYERLVDFKSKTKSMYLDQISIPGLHHNPFTENDASLQTLSDAIIDWTKKRIDQSATREGHHP